MAQLNDDGSLDFSQDDWQAPQVKKTTRQQTLTDPAMTTNELPGDQAPQPAPIPLPSPTAPAAPAATADPGNGTTWAPGASQPTGAPAGQVWDPTMANFVNNPAAAAPTGDAAIRAYISQLAGMPGADPSLSNDPDYWVKAINSRGGLTDSNKQYWQDASVGPTAFFNNPNREGAQTASGGGGTAAAGSGNNSQLSSLLMQLLSQRGNSTDPARSALMSRLSGLMDQYSQPVTADDPTIKASTDAYTGQVNRSVDAYKKQAAERAYAEGVPTGSFDSQVGEATMAGGRSIGDAQSQMMRDEMLSRRQNLISTLNSASGLLSQQDQADIQSKIAAMDAVLKEQGIDVNSQLGNKGLDIQQLLGLLGAGNQSTAIDNQNNQFYDQLGSTNANESAQIDLIMRELGLK